MSENILNNNALASLAQRAAPQVLSAIKHASHRTGVNFAYLMEQAAAESSFNAKAESQSSSATGLYQFIESTWLNMVKKHGNKYGLGHLASKINDKGHVADKQTRQAILDLRKDPKKAALLAAEFASENQQYLERSVDGKIGATELYFAHFMGAGGAAGFLNAMKDNPLQTAADLFPKAARANRNVFYDSKTGEPRTLAGVYDFFAKKFKASEGDTSQMIVKNNVKTNSYDKSLLAAKAYQLSMQRSNPFLLPSNNTSDWHTMPSLPRPALLLGPADLMLLARRDLPHEKTGNRAF